MLKSELLTFTQKSGLSHLIRDNWQPYAAVDIYSRMTNSRHITTPKQRHIKVPNKFISEI